MDSSAYQLVDYQEFRKILDAAGGKRVKQIASGTVLYDRRDRPLALMQQATIDNHGRCLPNRYFVNRLQHTELALSA